MNDRECHRPAPNAPAPHRRRLNWQLLCCTVLLASPTCVFAQLAVTAAATSQYEYNTNVFDQQHGFAIAGLNTPGYSDYFIAYGGKLDATYLWSQQQFHFVGIGTDYHYDRFTELNHSEYTLDGAWNWKVGRIVDGLLEVSRVRSMVSLYNLIEAQLALQTEQRETGKIGIQFVPDWRAEASGYTRRDQVPLLDVANLPETLSLTETSGQGAIKYTGTAGVTAGVSAGYLRGSYSGTASNGGPLTAVAPAYHQTNAALTATDIVTGLSTFTGQIGYSQRSSASNGLGGGINNVSGVTGEFDYKRALTAKTTAELDLSRQINAYITNTGSEIDTIAVLSANWQATYKIGVAVSYNFTYRQLPDQGDVPVGSNRTDRLNFISLAVDYEPATWLTLKPYANYQDRKATNFAGGNFNATSIGVQFSLHLQHGVVPPPTPFQIQAP